MDFGVRFPDAFFPILQSQRFHTRMVEEQVEAFRIKGSNCDGVRLLVDKERGLTILIQVSARPSSSTVSGGGSR